MFDPMPGASRHLRAGLISLGVLAATSPLGECEEPVPWADWKQPKQFKMFVTGLGKPSAGTGSIRVSNRKPGDLKSDIMPTDADFKLSEAAIDALHKSLGVYPVAPFNGFSAEVRDAKFPDVDGVVVLSYPNGQRLKIVFEKLDSISLGYAAPGSEEWQMREKLMWPNSEFLSTVLYALSTDVPSSRWRAKLGDRAK